MRDTIGTQGDTAHESVECNAHKRRCTHGARHAKRAGSNKSSDRSKSPNENKPQRTDLGRNVDQVRVEVAGAGHLALRNVLRHTPHAHRNT